MNISFSIEKSDVCVFFRDDMGPGGTLGREEGLKKAFCVDQAKVCPPERFVIE